MISSERLANEKKRDALALRSADGLKPLSPLNQSLSARQDSSTLAQTLEQRDNDLAQR